MGNGVVVSVLDLVGMRAREPAGSAIARSANLHVCTDRCNPADVFATTGGRVNLFRVLRLTVAKRPVLFADLNQTNEHVFPA